MKNSIDQPLHYIRKNRRENVIIYLKENEHKIAQKLFCYLCAWDNDYEVVGEITNLNEIKDCDLVLIANVNIFAEDNDEYCKIKKELKRKSIRLKIAIDETNEEEYMERALDLFRKGF